MAEENEEASRLIEEAFGNDKDDEVMIAENFKFLSQTVCQTARQGMNLSMVNPAVVFLDSVLHEFGRLYSAAHPDSLLAATLRGSENT